MKRREMADHRFQQTSPPTRGAWIETERLTEAKHRLTRRPPRGGRGLKQKGVIRRAVKLWSPPTWGLD